MMRSTSAQTIFQQGFDVHAVEAESTVATAISTSTIMVRAAAFPDKKGGMKLVVGIVLLAACGSVSENVDAPPAPPADTNASDTPADSTSRRCDPAKPFGTPVRFAELSSNSNDLWPSLTADELTLYFHSDRGGASTLGSDDIFVATRPSLTSPFGAPRVVANVNNTGYDQCPSITGDGLFLYTTRLASGTTEWDIWAAQRASTSVDFGTPTRVDTLNASGPTFDSNQYVLPNNSAIYFATNRVSTSNMELYRATRNAGGTFDAATPTITMPASNENSVVVTPDELTMYFGSDATPTLGTTDIWMSKRTTTTDGWGTPTHLTELSTDQQDFVTAISGDGCNIYISHFTAGMAQEIFWARKTL